jgi:endogenous inhibitor of DNA gyrase (YacG/DUF329 family)
MAEQMELRCSLCGSTIECVESEPVSDKKVGDFCCQNCRDISEQLRSSYLIDAASDGLDLRTLGALSGEES